MITERAVCQTRSLLVGWRDGGDEIKFESEIANKTVDRWNICLCLPQRELQHACSNTHSHTHTNTHTHTAVTDYSCWSGVVCVVYYLSLCISSLFSRSSPPYWGFLIMERKCKINASTGGRRVKAGLVTHGCSGSLYYLSHWPLYSS